MDYVPKLAKNCLYVAIKVNCRVKVDHLLVHGLHLSLVKIPITLDIFKDMCSIWLFQFKCLLIINPRKSQSQLILFLFFIISGSIFFSVADEIIYILI